MMKITKATGTATTAAIRHIRSCVFMPKAVGDLRKQTCKDILGTGDCAQVLDIRIAR